VKALSIRQPWAWMILHAGKDIENRSWRTNFRGRVLIHASKGMDLSEYDDALWLALQAGAAGSVRSMPMSNGLVRGGIIGSVEIVDCVSASGSPWFCGPFGFVLRNPQPLRFRMCRGGLGFFNVEEVVG
jgi:hypothetical protein